MSKIHSFLRSFHKQNHNTKKHHRVLVAAMVCTLATGTLILTGEEQYITNATITAEAKENKTLQSASIKSMSAQETLLQTEQTDVAKDIKLLSKYDTKQETMVGTIIEQTKTQIQETIEEKKQMLERDLKASAEAQKQRQEALKKAEEEKKKAEAKKIKLRTSEIKVLQRIVEAEAGDQDVKGRMLVANVVLNRVKSKQFPDSVKEVVYEHSKSCYQFSPVLDGSINRVKVSKTTKQAVNRVLNGEDESKGALYFVQRNIANKKSLSWFDRDLTRLFKHGCHTFYK